MLPILLDVTGRRVLVVGGGPVGRRKAATALAAGAAVHVVALEPRPADLDAAVTWHREPYRADHLAGAALAFASATPAVNTRVVADATARGVWVCDAADPGRGTFALPAVARRGGLTVAVGTGGASPTLARRLRDRFAAELDEAYAAWVDLLAEARTLAAAVPDPSVRARLLAGLADWPWLDRVRRDGPAVTRAAMRAAVAAAAGPAAGGAGPLV